MLIVEQNCYKYFNFTFHEGQEVTIKTILHEGNVRIKMVTYNIRQPNLIAFTLNPFYNKNMKPLKVRKHLITQKKNKPITINTGGSNIKHFMDGLVGFDSEKQELASILKNNKELEDKEYLCEEAIHKILDVTDRYHTMR